MTAEDNSDSNDDDDDGDDTEAVFNIELSDVSTQDCSVLLGGLALIQMDAMQYGDIETVADAAALMEDLIEDNPLLVRKTLLDNQDSFRGKMPDDALDKLDLDTRDGKFIDVSDDGDWIDVDVE